MKEPKKKVLVIFLKVQKNMKRREDFSDTQEEISDQADDTYEKWPINSFVDKEYVTLWGNQFR